MQGYLQFTFIHHADLLSLTRVRCRTPVHFQFTMLIYAHLDFASNSPVLIHHDLGLTRRVPFQFTMLLSSLYAFFKCCFTSKETVRTIRDGEPRTSTSAFTAPELCLSALLYVHQKKKKKKKKKTGLLGIYCVTVTVLSSPQRRKPQ